MKNLKKISNWYYNKFVKKYLVDSESIQRSQIRKTVAASMG
jgi:hypothetical protein